MSAERKAGAAVGQRLRRAWLRLLEARIRRIDRKQNRLSEAKTDAMVYAARHRRNLDG